ncbi:MAG TPA: alpha/beta hydrolase [Steroidobacteraceae bacterium]|nr:alpha/beta hydrolase [Steroidobacteraceae bacterium]
MSQPFFFGDDTRPLFGVLHRASPGATLGLVLCNPFGFESICAHRTLRHIADEAAAAGIPALRFDYDGSGDSAGSDSDPDRLGAWLRSVHGAADELKRVTGCTRIALLGVRLGATLATLAAAERDDVAGVIALAPVVSARTYLRELRAMQSASVGTASSMGGDAASQPALEAMGFIVSAETRDALSAIDLAKAARAPAPHVLILDRQDLPVAEKWHAALAAQGVSAERQVLPGYVEMMLAPHSSIVPAAMLDATRQFLAARRAAPSPAVATATAAAPAGDVTRTSVLQDAGDGTRVRESVEYVDASRTVFGVLTAPRDATPRSAIVLLSAGATHHIGPSRLYVTLARQWAALGYAVFRMDVSGIGDSRPHPGEPENVVYTRHAAQDVAATANWLRAKVGVAECYALGLCAGAYHAFKAAVGGVPLDGVVMINPLTFFWKDGMSLDEKLADQRVIQGAAYYRKNAFSGAIWRKLLRGEVNVLNVAQIVLSRAAVTLRHATRDVAKFLNLKVSDDLGRELETVAGRGTNMLFVFADHEPGIELLRLQGGSAVGKLRDARKLDLQIIPNADHTFTAWAARQQLTSYLVAAMSLIAP